MEGRGLKERHVLLETGATDLLTSFEQLWTNGNEGSYGGNIQDLWTWLPKVV